MRSANTSDVVICGAGITGVAAAYYLSKRGVRDILLIDERPPLTLTSAYSTECYRNWWPDAAMLQLMNRSIDLMESLADESGNSFGLNRRGYLYLTADDSNADDLRNRARRIAQLDAGELRIHSHASAGYRPAALEGYTDQPEGADLLLDPDLILRFFPGVTPEVKAGLHVRRAGWLSAQQLGMYLLARAAEGGTRVLSARVAGLKVRENRPIEVELDDGQRISAGAFVNAAGPFIQDVAGMAGLDLPVRTELHLKATIADSRRVVDRGAPLLIWADPQVLPWESSARESLSADPSTRWMALPFPSGVHTRPEGGAHGNAILMLWEYHPEEMKPTLPPPTDPAFPEIAIRGLSRMLPRMQEYFGNLPRPVIDGGYYTRTPENRPIIGPTSVEGMYVLGAVSGFGIMSACAAGELLASHLTAGTLPEYEAVFRLSRYDDPGYLPRAMAALENGQL